MFLRRDRSESWHRHQHAPPEGATQAAKEWRRTARSTKKREKESRLRLPQVTHGAGWCMTSATAELRAPTGCESGGRSAAMAHGRPRPRATASQGLLPPMPTHGRRCWRRCMDFASDHALACVCNMPTYAVLLRLRMNMSRWLCSHKITCMSNCATQIDETSKRIVPMSS